MVVWDPGWIDLDFWCSLILLGQSRVSRVIGNQSNFATFHGRPRFQSRVSKYLNISRRPGFKGRQLGPVGHHCHPCLKGDILHENCYNGDPMWNTIVICTIGIDTNSKALKWLILLKQKEVKHPIAADGGRCRTWRCCASSSTGWCWWSGSWLCWLRF